MEEQNSAEVERATRRRKNLHKSHNEVQKVSEDEKVVQKHEQQTNNVYKVVEAEKIEVHTATTEAGKKPVVTQSMESENALDSVKAQMATSEQFRAVGWMKIEGIQGQSQDDQRGEGRDVKSYLRGLTRRNRARVMRA